MKSRRRWMFSAKRAVIYSVLPHLRLFSYSPRALLSKALSYNIRMSTLDPHGLAASFRALLGVAESVAAFPQTRRS